jgi:hypothetical protein
MINGILFNETPAFNVSWGEICGEAVTKQVRPSLSDGEQAKARHSQVENNRAQFVPKVQVEDNPMPIPRKQKDIPPPNLQPSRRFSPQVVDGTLPVALEDGGGHGMEHKPERQSTRTSFPPIPGDGRPLSQWTTEEVCGWFADTLQLPQYVGNIEDLEVLHVGSWLSTATDEQLQKVFYIQMCACVVCMLC